MSQLVKDTKSEPESAKKKRRVHKRTIAVVLCVVIFPWALIAIPGTLNTGRELSGQEIYHLLHGWPFVHLETTHYHKVTHPKDGRYGLGQLPWNMDSAKSAKEAAAIFTKRRSPVQLNLRLEKDRYRVYWLGEIGFWSEISNWPAFKMGVHLTPRYFGILLNLLCLALLVLIVVALCERRIRRQGKLLKYSLANLLIGIAMIAIACYWIAGIHLDYAAEVDLDKQLRSTWNNRDVDQQKFHHFRKNHEARFPLIISQILNHGKHPWGAAPFFRRVESGTICLVLRGTSEISRFRKMKRIVTPTQYSIELTATDFNPTVQETMNALDGLNFVDLNLNFDTTPWSHEEIARRREETEQRIGEISKDDQLPKGEKDEALQTLLNRLKKDREEFDWAQEIEKSGFKVDLNFDMSKVESLLVKLDPAIPQQQQLQPFVDLPSLKLAHIFPLTTEGAEFLWSTKEQWPEEMKLFFHDDVSKELQDKLKTEFAN